MTSSGHSPLTPPPPPARPSLVRESVGAHPVAAARTTIKHRNVVRRDETSDKIIEMFFFPIPFGIRQIKQRKA